MSPTRKNLTVGALLVGALTAFSFCRFPDVDGPTFGEARSPQWQTVRNNYIAKHPKCEACGTTKDLNCHHVIPFHTTQGKRLELDESNLITLCREHHFTIGHDPDGPKGPKQPNWQLSNSNVRLDAKAFKR